MQYLLVFVMFVMAVLTAGHACILENGNRGEVVVNYILALMSIVFGLGFSMSLTLLLTGEVKNLHIMTLLVVLPAFCGIVMGDRIRKFEGFRSISIKPKSGQRSKC
jgi:hypothetical protein